MKIKIKFDIKGNEGSANKTYTKTFIQVNEKSTNDNLMKFAEAYLSLVNGKDNKIAYSIYKANEEEVYSGSVN